MAAIYGYRWTSSYGESAEDDAGKLTITGDTWQRGLQDVGEQRIGTGLNACIHATDPWPPTLPQFRSMCLGVPSLSLVRLTFNGGTASTAFTRKMWQNLDAFRLKRADADTADRMMRDAYEVTCEYVMKGAALPPDPVAAIEKQPPQTDDRPRAPVDVDKIINDLADKLRTPPTTPPTEVDP